MEKKQACHVEWGRLQLTGQPPIMAGTAIGAAQLMWVACRTFNRLVHVFQDGHLMSIWRFASDPVCLLFGPDSRNQAAAGIGADNSSKTITEASLLVITLDGRLWQLDLTNNCLPVYERPIKRRKEAVMCELPKVVHETLITEVDAISSLAPTPHQEYERDVHIYEAVCSRKPEKVDVGYPPDGGKEELRVQNSGDVSVNANCTTGAISADREECLGFSGLKLHWKKLAVHNQARYSKKPEVKLVTATALLGVGPATSVAAYGPNGIVAYFSASGVVNIIQLSFSHSCRKTSATSVGEKRSLMMSNEPTCILFVSLMPEGETIPLRGNDAVLSKQMFETLFGEVRQTTPTLGMLRGDSDGFVYTISLDPSETGVESCTRVLCNLQQPILAILVIPFDKSAGKEYEGTRSIGPSKSKDFYGDSLLILGQLGRAILIKGVREESNDLENGPFLPVRNLFSWRTKDKSSTVAQLTEKCLAIHEWNLNCSITSACMLGCYRLCYCSGSEILYADLFETIGHNTIHLKLARAENNSGIGAPMINPFSSKPESTRKPSHTSSSDLQRQKWVVKEELVSHIVPVADVVVAIVGRGILGRSGGSRPLVALTARGRLLGVEVSDLVSSPTLFESIEGQKSWQPLQARKEEQVKDLLQAVSEVAERTALIKSHHFSITLTLKELANAFPLVYDICSDQTRDTIRCADLSEIGEGPPSKLWCFLTVTVHPSLVISPEMLSFGSGMQKMPSNHGSNPQVVQISIKLHNQTPVTLSRYWSLILEFHSLHSDPTEVVSYSVVINRGLGLAVGAYFSHDFLAELPGIGFCPLLASVFLCHLNDPHQSIIDLKRQQSPFSRSHLQSLKGNIESKILLSDIREKPTSKWKVSDKEKTERCFVDELSTSKTSGSICLLLAHYRIDLLLLLRPPPPQSGVSPWIHPKMRDKTEQLEASSNNLLGIFSGIITLSRRDNVIFNVSSDRGKLWQGLHLGDLMDRGILSKAAQRISLSAPDDGTISVSLECRPVRGEASILLLFQASSLLLGSLAREAFLWRISVCETKAILQESIPGNLLDKFDACPQVKERVLDDANELLQRLLSVTSLWRRVLTSRDSEIFLSLLDDTGCVTGELLKMYRILREHSPSLCIT